MSTVLELYEKLKPKLGDEESRALLEFVEGSVERGAATKEDLKLAVTTLREEITAVGDEVAVLRATTASKEDLQRATTAMKEDLQRATTAMKEDLQRATTAMKEDLQQVTASLKEEVTVLKTTAATKEELRRTEQSLRDEIHQLDQKIETVKTAIALAHADLLKWTFGFWIGAVAVLSGITFAIVRALVGK